MPIARRALLLLLALCIPAAAQSPTLAELAMYSGPDRTERLIAGAKKEGVLNGLFVDDHRRHARAHRRLREEIRRQDAVLARQLREHPAPRADRAARRPLRGRRHRDQRRRDGIAASRGHAAGGALAASRRHRAGGAAPAPRMGRRPAQHHLRRLQHQAGRARTSCRRPTRTSPIRTGRGGSGSSPTTRSGSARSPTRWARRRSSSCSATWCGSTACRCARATRCSPIWWSPARCSSRSRSITTRRSS